MSISRSEPRAGCTVVIGLGNPLMGDDGLGLAALARLGEQWNMPPEVELVDGGTWGLNLLPIIEDAERVLLIDAIDVGAAPGTEVVIARQGLPRYLATKISPHQVDLREVLALAELRGTLPEQTTAIGLQPGRIELSDELSDLLRSHLDDLANGAVRLLASWGHVCACKELSGKAKREFAHRSATPQQTVQHRDSGGRINGKSGSCGTRASTLER